MSKIKRITKVEKASEERLIITAMIIDPAFFRQIRPIAKTDYFKAPFAAQVAAWCLEYWDEYKDAPGRRIEQIYKANDRAGTINEDLSELVSQFLESISEEYERSDDRPTEYYAKTAEKYFRKRALEQLQEDVTQYAQTGDLEGAEQLVSGFKRPARDEGGYCNPFTDEDGIREAFTHSATPLFRLPGALGELLNDLLVRDGFISLMGPEKRGKTFWLMYLSMKAARAGLNVAFFAVGDMTERQMKVRYGIMTAMRSNKPRYCGEIKIPVLDCLLNQSGDCDHEYRKEYGPPLANQDFDDNPDHVPCCYCARDKEFRGQYKGATWWDKRSPVEPLDWRDALKATKEFWKRAKGNFRLSTHSNSSINVRQIDAVLTTWKNQDGYVPDVVFIDYADILAPEDPRADNRTRENDRWKAGRKLSQDWNNLLVWATQSDAMSYKQDLIDESNFSEDKRKYSHVTGIVTLNQAREEKRRGEMRLGTMFLRDDDFEYSRTVTVLQSLATGRPAVASYWTPPKKKKEKNND